MGTFELTHFQKLLSTLLKDLRGHGTKWEGVRAERFSDPFDLGQHLGETELAVHALNARWTAVRSVTEALRRMENGDYGICERCGDTIALKRLQAIPWAKFCLECQAEEDLAGREMADKSNEPRQALMASG
jgi:DnaK suppressor protein